MGRRCCRTAALIDYITGTLGGEVGSEYVNPTGQGRIVVVEKEP